MFKTVFTAIIAIGLLPSFASSQERLAAADPEHVLTRAEFDALLAHPEQLLIVDVRRPDELTAIGGFAVYLSIQPADIEKSLASIPRERTIVTVSNHANRAIRVAKVLAANGFRVAGTVGAQNYEEEGGKLTKLAPPVKAAAPADKPAAATH